MEGINDTSIDYILSYQSRVGPLKWIGPSTDDEIIKYSKENFDSLYTNISEFVFNEDSEYEIILKNGRTKILLGDDNIFVKIDNLNAFATALPSEKTLESYRYIDLRYKRQIVVEEI